MAEFWRDHWCFLCHGLRRFEHDEKGVWRCHCGTLAVPAVSRHLDEDEAASHRHVVETEPFLPSLRLET